MKLSVIIANYNNESYIRQCLDSVLVQKWKDLEIIVADDCSGDGSPEIIREYEQKYPDTVRGLFLTVNGGPARARHEAICRANGTYFTTLDSDDYYHDPKKLKKEMRLVLRHKKKFNRDIAAYSNIIIDNCKDPIRKDQLKRNPAHIREGNIFDAVITRTCMIPRDFVISKDAYFDVGGYDFAFPIYEDWDLKLRLAHRFDFYYSGCNGTVYRRHGRGLSAAAWGEHEHYLELIFNKNLHLSPSDDPTPLVRKLREFIEQRRGK